MYSLFYNEFRLVGQTHSITSLRTACCTTGQLASTQCSPSLSLSLSHLLTFEAANTVANGCTIKLLDCTNDRVNRGGRKKEKIMNRVHRGRKKWKQVRNNILSKQGRWRNSERV